MRQFFIRRWFLIALAACLVGGISFASGLEPLVQWSAIRNGIVFCVLFLMAFPLSAGSIWNTLRRPAVPLVAGGLNFLILPLAAWGMSLGLEAIGAGPRMIAGFLVAAATPCTLASAAVWTRRAGGNDAAAIMVTMLTNATCFLVTPFWLWATTGRRDTGGALDVGEMVQKLLLLVVLPMALAQLVRLIPPAGKWATRRKTTLGVLALCGVLSMVFLGSIQTGLRLAKQNPGSATFLHAAQRVLAALNLAASQAPLLALLIDIALAAAAVMTLHISILALGHLVAHLAGFRREDRIAVGFAGSQKTLMVGLQVSLELGYSAIPMVAYHVGQLLVDTLIADRLKRRGDALAGQEKLAAPPPPP